MTATAASSSGPSLTEQGLQRTAMFDPKKMLFRNLGNSGLRVPVFSLGGWLTLGGTQKGDIVKDIMSTAFDNGINMFDLAEGYAAGNCEVECGRVVREMGWQRSDLIITTKIFFGTNRLDLNSKGLSRKHLIEGLDHSLARLGMKYVDVVFAHRPDSTVPMEEVVRGFDWLINSGRAFYWGTSEWSAQQIQEAHEVAGRLGLIAPIAEQPQYSMLCRDRMEGEYAPLQKEKKMGATTFSGLKCGVLTGKYNNGIPEDSRFSYSKNELGDMVERFDGPDGLAMIEKVKKLTPIAEEKLQCTVAQLALAWVIKNENVSSCILGASRPQQVLDNLVALDVLPKLTPEIMQEIDAILENKPVLPAQYGREKYQA